MATYVIFSTSGNRTMSVGSTWTITRDGTGSLVFGNNQGGTNVWRQDGTGDWQAPQAYTRFETDVLDTDEHITGAGIRYNISGTNTNFFVSHVRKAASMPSASTWVTGANLASLPFMGRGRFGPSTTTPVGIDPAQLNRTADTFVMTYPRELEVSSNPTNAWEGSGLSGWANNETATSRPRLIVHTVPPSTMDGAIDASVQLSDGSTVFLERTGQGLPASNLALKRTDASGTTTVLDAAAGETTWAPNAATLVCDANDNIITFITDATSRLRGYRYLASDGWSSRQAWQAWDSLNDLVTDGDFKESGVAAVFCDAGNGTDGRGRVLAIVADAERGNLGFYVFDVAHLISNATVIIQSRGVNPAWMRVAANYTNVSGAGLSVATDVFGGTRAAVVVWQNTALLVNNDTHTFVSRLGIVDVSSTVSSVGTSAPNASTTPFMPARVKAVGVGPNRFVLWVPSSSSILRVYSVNGLSVEHNTFVSYDGRWDAIHYRDASWLYFWDGTKLMRRPYFYETNNLGTAEEVNDFGGLGDRNVIRTPKMLRVPRFTEVHHNLTEA